SENIFLASQKPVPDRANKRCRKWRLRRRSGWGWVGAVARSKSVRRASIETDNRCFGGPKIYGRTNRREPHTTRRDQGRQCDARQWRARGLYRRRSTVGHEQQLVD